MAAYTFYIVLRFVTLAIGVIINGLTLVLILHNEKLRDQRNVFTFNLALADFTAATCEIFIATLPFKPVVIALKLIFHCALLVSVLSVLAVACFRFIAISVDPFGHRMILTTRRCIAGSALMWLLLVGPLMIIKYATDAYSTVLLLINPIIMFSSLAITAMCYVMTYRDISSAGSGEAGIGGTEQLKGRQRENRKVLRTFVVITLTSCVCWIVHCFHDILQIYSIWYDNIDAVSNILVAVNFVLDPVIYWWRLDEFRAVLVKAVRRTGIGRRIRKMRGRVGDSSSGSSVTDSEKVFSVSEKYNTVMTSALEVSDA
ncbi:uncharacterized protein [Diadema setosum]|uniref:uncharacterized protein n=1 Tax=Diadema setosum TaxID=31175 RepID=UPI003B3B0689